MFKEKFKEIRKERGKTQKEFSSITAIPLRTIEEWERGTRKPPKWMQRIILSSLKKKENEDKIFEIWEEKSNIKIREIIATDIDEAWQIWNENYQEDWKETYDMSYIEIRYKPNNHLKES